MTLANLIGFPERGPGTAANVPANVQRLLSLCESLLSECGEVSGVRLASETLAAYEAFDSTSRDAFFEALASRFAPDPAEAGRWADAYRQDPTAANLIALQHAVESPRHELFSRLNTAPGGTRVLANMRAHILRGLPSHSEWAAVEADLGRLLTAWFNRGFVTLRRIDWNTPASILEKLIQYEAVHAIQGWADLHRRLQADRRCFAFFHPGLPDEPLIFVEAALTRGMSDRIRPLLDPASPIADPAAADCATFYSITNCQEGLRGIPFGSFLLKKVAEDLSVEFPRLKTFATLSPVPGFSSWLSKVAPPTHPDSATEQTDVRLEELCAYYLTRVKQGNEPADPVARFHLRNGARLERIHLQADPSPAGLKKSSGIMVNYLYRLPDLERNHELYAKEDKVISSHHIAWLAKNCRLKT